MSYTDKELKGVRNYLIPQMLKRTLKEDFDHVVLIVGKEGVGKSTLALLLADLIIKEKNKLNNTNNKLNVDEVVYYDLQELEDAVFSNSSSGDVKIIDEGAITGGYKRQAMSRGNKSLNETLMTCRSRNQILLFLIPDINAVDSGIIRRANTTIRVVNRGHAWVYHEKEARLMIRWNTKYKRYEFKQRPFLHLEKYRTVQKIIDTKTWNDYINHKEVSLRDRNKPKGSSNKDKKNSNYLTPKEVHTKYKLGKKLLLKLRNNNELDFYYQGNAYIYNEASIKDYLERQRPSNTKFGGYAGVNGRENNE